jgi:hypothetical protein
VDEAASHSRIFIYANPSADKIFASISSVGEHCIYYFGERFSLQLRLKGIVSVIFILKNAPQSQFLRDKFTVDIETALSLFLGHNHDDESSPFNFGVCFLQHSCRRTGNNASSWSNIQHL